MHRTILSITILLTTIAHAENTTNSGLNQALNATNNNDHTLQQTITINPQNNDPANCTLLTGNALNHCMACQSPENFRKNLTAFNDRMARNYFLSLNLHQYQEAISNFTEDQWKQFIATRSPEFRDKFPPSIYYQRYVLKKIYIRNYYTNVISFLWSGQRFDRVDDLEQVRADYNAADYCGELFEFQKRRLHEEFEIYKKQMFKANS